MRLDHVLGCGASIAPQRVASRTPQWIWLAYAEQDCLHNVVGLLQPPFLIDVFRSNFADRIDERQPKNQVLSLCFAPLCLERRR